MNDNFKFSLGDLFDKAIHTIGKYSDYYVSDYVYTSGLEDLNDEGVRILEYRDAKDWNIDFRFIPGFEEVSKFFKSGYKHFANDHEYICEMFEYSALKIINHLSSYSYEFGIEDVKKNTWIIIKAIKSNGFNVVTLEAFYGHKDYSTVYNDYFEALHEFIKILPEYFSTMDKNLGLLSYIACCKCTEFVTESNYPFIYRLNSPKIGYSIGNGGPKFNLDKWNKDFNKINIPCLVNFKRSYGVDEVYNINSLKDLELAMYTELNSLINFEINKKDVKEGEDS